MLLVSTVPKTLNQLKPTQESPIFNIGVAVFKLEKLLVLEILTFCFVPRFSNNKQKFY